MICCHSAAWYSQQTALATYGLATVVDVAPEDEPLQLADAYDHLRIYHDESGSDDDSWLTLQLPACREYCELECGIAFAPRTLELTMSTFPSTAYIELPYGPVQSITSVDYLDFDGTPQTMPDTDYELDSYVNPARAVLAYGAAWPAARSTTNSVKVRYVAGYSLMQLPRSARSAMLLMLGHLFENREGVADTRLQELPLGVMRLLELIPHRERLGIA